MPEPILPSRIIPRGEPLPVHLPEPQPGSTPPPPPPPFEPADPTGPAAAPPGGWHSTPAPPPPPVHVEVHLPAQPEPEPGPGWIARLRPGYNIALILASSPVAAAWADVLTAARDEAGLAGAWVIALVPLAVVAFADNVYSTAAAGAAPQLWAPRIRAAAARYLLWAALCATAVALPVATIVYIITGVRP